MEMATATQATRRVGRLLPLIAAAIVCGCGSPERQQGLAEPIEAAPTTEVGVPSSPDSASGITIDDSVPAHLATALAAADAAATREFLERQPLILPGPESLPRPESADDLEYAEATDFGPVGHATSVAYTRWIESGPVDEAWFALSASHDAAIPDDIPYTEVPFGDGVAYVSPDLTSRCNQNPSGALDPAALYWQHGEAQYLLEVLPIPECSGPFTWADVQAIVGSLLTCSLSDGRAHCVAADLPKLPDDSPAPPPSSN